MADDNHVELEKYTKDYSEHGLWHKVKGTVKKAGVKLIYNTLLLYYVTENPNCPKKVKAGIFAALGYFISPLDVIPDFTPIAGFTDDTGTIAAMLIVARFYIDDTVKQKAKSKMCSLFGDKIANNLN